MTVTPEYFRRNFDGSFDGSDDELSKLLELSVISADNYCAGNITRNYDRCSARQQELIKKAVCYQTEWIISNGGIDCLDDSSVASATLGSFSYTSATANSSSGSSSNTIKLCQTAYTLLLNAGMIYRGTVVV